jgi:hypothetical protein
MLTCVAWTRLDRIKINGRFTGGAIREKDLVLIRKAVLHSMGMERWRDMELAVQGERIPVEIP